MGLHGHGASLLYTHPPVPENFSWALEDTPFRRCVYCAVPARFKCFRCMNSAPSTSSSKRQGLPRLALLKGDMGYVEEFAQGALTRPHIACRPVEPWAHLPCTEMLFEIPEDWIAVQSREAWRPDADP